MKPKACDRCGEPLDDDDTFYKLEDSLGAVGWYCEICHDDLEAMNDDEFTNEIYGLSK